MGVGGIFRAGILETVSCDGSFSPSTVLSKLVLSLLFLSSGEPESLPFIINDDDV